MSRSRKPKRNAKPQTPSSERSRIGRIAAAGLGLGLSSSPLARQGKLFTGYYAEASCTGQLGKEGVHIPLPTGN